MGEAYLPVSRHAIKLAEIVPKKNGNDEFVGPSAITKEEVAAKIRGFSSSATENSINAVADAVMRQKGNERKLLAQLEKLDALDVLAGHKPYFTYGDDLKNTCDVLLKREVADLFVRHTGEMLLLSANNLNEEGKGFTERLFTALASPQVAEVFERHTGEFLEISAALKNSMAYFCEGLVVEGVAGLFERHPKAFLELSRNLGGKSSYAVNTLEVKELARFFDEKPDEAVSAYSRVFGVFEQSFGHEAQLIETPALTQAFIDNHDEMAKSFEKIRSASLGKGQLHEPNETCAEILDFLCQKGVAEKYAKDIGGVTAQVVEIEKSASGNGKFIGAVFSSMAQSEAVCRVFANEPDTIIGIIRNAGANAAGFFRTFSRGTEETQKAGISEEELGAFFERHSSNLAAIADKCSNSIEQVAELLVGKLRQVFESRPGAFVELANEARHGTHAVLDKMANDPALFEAARKLASKETTLEQFEVAVYSNESFASELSRRLDDYHDYSIAGNEQRRMKNLQDMPPEMAIGLLASNPKLLLTSSNNMLFGKFNELCREEGVGATGMLKKYGIALDSPLGRNVLFRAINYAKLKKGVNDGLFTASEMDGVLPALLKPIGGKFDLDYYFCLADTIKGFKAAGYGKELETALEAAVETDDALKRKSINFILDYLKNPEKLEAFGKFDRAKFCNEEGKLYIVHVFDKDDTKEAHWDLTQEWAKKYLPAGAAPQVSEDGKRIVYEGKGVKIELFMGNDAAENQEFVQRALNANEGGTGMVLAFRGHSFSLEENFPPYIFGNRGTDIFFAPNSCGSASMIKSYIASNPETGMHVFGNKSTGRGQVFNYGILDGLIESAPSMKNGVRTLPTYSSMLERKKTSIEKYGGSIDTLEMPDSLSFLLMSHLYGNAN